MLIDNLGIVRIWDVPRRKCLGSGPTR